MKGWILDAYPDHERDLMDLWVIEESRKRSMLAHRYTPSIIAAGSQDDLKLLEGHLEGVEGVRSFKKGEALLDIQDRHPRHHLKIDISSYSKLTDIAKGIEAFGSYRRFTLYDVDLRLPSRYMYSHGIFPLAHVDMKRGYRLLRNHDWASEPLPPMKAAVLHAIPDQKGPVPGMTDRMRYVRLGDFEMENEKEDRMIISLVREMQKQDPDIVVTYGGDSFVLPYIYERALANDMAESLKLHRSNRPFRAPGKTGKSYFSYGVVYYKPPYYPLKGRIHLDLENSFMIREGGLVGLSVLSKMSLLPLQTMARLSPGSAISYMECVEAMRRGRAVRWKKNIPEGWKTAVELSRSDRGGHIFDPNVGAYSDVIEMDFSSFYPHIMWRKNLSVETLNCGCCEPEGFDAPNRAPGLNYHFCTRGEGLIPSVVGEILESRLRYKTSFREGEDTEQFEVESELGPLRPPAGSKRYQQASNTLKWVLVTCFGYTGYKNARFGRIEVHESITAYARDMILKAKDIVEEHGYHLLHGIVDSMWMTGPREKAHDVAALAEEDIGIPIGVDAVYKWLVFLPNKTNGAGALNRYYGLNEDGEMKFRGIECRQHSTPYFIKEAQEEMLTALSGAGGGGEIPDHLPRAFDVMRERGRMIMEREVNPKELAITIRASRNLEDYTTRSEHVSAMTLLKREGVDVKGGQKVRFVVLDHEAKKHENRVALVHEEMGEVRYDAQRYLELTARAMSSALAVFGVDEARALRVLKGVEQKGLDEFVGTLG
ncbi:MAG: DNA polymerase domain-containing protein [Thermoplasmatota archaeon]